MGAALASAEEAPADFTAEAKLLYRVVACGGEGPVPEGFNKKVVAAHCQELRGAMDDYRKRWLNRAKPFLAKLVPRGIPDKVVYPFGGGDLLSALATFPDAGEITTLSLERSGDARLINSAKGDRLNDSLTASRKRIVHLFRLAHSLTLDMKAAGHEALPGELVYALVALAVDGFQPTRLRYFTLDSTGGIHYVTAAAIAEADKVHESGKLFANMELTFAPSVSTGNSAPPTEGKRIVDHAPRALPAALPPGGLRNPPRVPFLVTFQHIGANLDDKHMAADPSILKYLDQKGRVAAMTKAASYLLWWPDFSRVRGYLLAHMDWMISDSTGIPPRYAKPAGFEYITYGEFDGPFFKNSQSDVDAWKKIWDAPPKRPLPFRFGYPDNRRHAHLVITRKVVTKS